ncbi:MAG: uroporphyrinogen-III synthase [Xanthomonadales bacterium]|nr:uroporphyrinogen-III synthase [Xanthomonadales bacterium]
MKHILVTRPLESSEQLARQLEALGFIPIVMPLYTFAARKPAVDISSVWSEKRLRKLAVFTSPRAVQFGQPYIPAHDQLAGLELAVVGSATRASLESSGYPVHLQARSGFTSEDLLQIPGLAENPGVAVIYCAPGGRETLAEGLHALGWRIVKALVYERVGLQPDSRQVDYLRNAADLVSIWTSISALKLAKEYLPPDVWGKILDSKTLVISSRIRHYLTQLGAGRVELADGPGNPDLLKSILRLTGQQNTG